MQQVGVAIAGGSSGAQAAGSFSVVCVLVCFSQWWGQNQGLGHIRPSSVTELHTDSLRPVLLFN